MAYEISVSVETNVDSWQRAFWFSLASPCIYGLACAAIIQNTATAIAENFFRLGQLPSEPADDSLAEAMDVAIGEKSVGVTEMYNVVTMRDNPRALPVGVRRVAA